jgi:hypothetical protein
MDTHESDQVTMYASVGIDADVDIKVRLSANNTEAVEINIGYGPELILDVADVQSLERLRDVATEGARLLRERIEKNRASAQSAGAVASNKSVKSSAP